MKYFRSLLFAAAVLALGAAANAQHAVIKADVPFNFMVGDKLHPAGEYSVAKIATQSSVLQIHNQSVSESDLFQTIACSSNAQKKTTKLVFERTGSVYSLRQIWVAGSEFGWEVGNQKRTETRLAFNGVKTEELIVAANLIGR